MRERPHGNDWPPLNYGDLILQAKSRARSSHEEKCRRYSRYTDPADCGLLARLFGAGVPRWWLPLEGDIERDIDGDRAWRLAPWIRNRCRSGCDQHDRGYALDGLFRVQTFIICRRCGSRLDWPNFLQGRRVLTRNWQARLQRRTIGAAAWLLARLRRA